MRRRAVACPVVLLLAIAPSTAQRPTASSVVALEEWVSAVQQHAPGRSDASTAWVRSLSLERRRTLGGALPTFLAVLTGKGAGTTSTEERRIAEIARDLAERPGANALIHRAALLHADCAMLGDRVPIEGPAWRSNRGAAPSPRGPSPLVSGRPLLLEKDGEVVGREESNWNWTFARSLVDLVHPKPSSDPFVAAWYHATAAYMFAAGLGGEAAPHLAHARALLPDDARVLVDQAWLYEFNGLPRSQQLLSDADLIALRMKNQPGARVSSVPRLSEAASASGVLPAEITNAEAERLLRRALDVDPTLVEARVRLARLLDLRKRHAEALGELDRALAADLDPDLAYQAHLFAARAARALGHFDAARGHLREALARFPNAQSALIASSQLALVQADQAGALEWVRRLQTLPANPALRVDPWWQYELGPGRQVKALLADLWSKTP